MNSTISNIIVFQIAAIESCLDVMLYHMDGNLSAREVERDGTGLGLSIVRQVVERHHGSVWARNNESGGSTFSFRMPKKASEEQIS